MALTQAQIESLLQQALASGSSLADIEVMREFLTDRAAEMDGATRLNMAQQMLPADEQDAAETFLNAAGAIRSSIMTRGAQDVSAIDEDEWGRLIGE